MDKLWKFIDGWGMAVWGTPHTDGDTEQDMWNYWRDLMEGEEYDPEIVQIILEEKAYA